MLLTKEEAEKLEDELIDAIQMSKQLFDVLEYGGLTDLEEEIGIFARNMPEWKFLTKERKQVIELVRQICKKEISIDKAKEITETMINELQRARRLISIKQ